MSIAGLTLHEEVKQQQNGGAFSGFLKVGGARVFLKFSHRRDPLVAMGCRRAVHAGTALMWSDRCIVSNPWPVGW